MISQCFNSKMSLISSRPWLNKTINKCKLVFMFILCVNINSLVNRSYPISRSNRRYSVFATSSISHPLAYIRVNLRRLFAVGKTWQVFPATVTATRSYSFVAGPVDHFTSLYTGGAIDRFAFLLTRHCVDDIGAMATRRHDNSH